jgi:hypothetical protein
MLFFYASGIYNEPAERQIAEFIKELSRVFYQGTELKERNKQKLLPALLLQKIVFF